MTRGAPESVKGSNAWAWLALAWGFSEAVFFFIVPDVLTSRIVLGSARRGFAACAIAVAGALVGGVFLFQMGKAGFGLMPLMDYIPGINEALIERARGGLEAHGLESLFTGALGGIPYKLYAVQAPAIGAGFGAFLAFSAAARLLRFGVVTGIAWTSSRLMPRVSMVAKLRIHAIAWIVFYACYFWRMGF